MLVGGVGNNVSAVPGCAGLCQAVPGARAALFGICLLAEP